jgi:hypothetical protein
MEATNTSEATLNFHQTTQHNNSEDSWAILILATSRISNLTEHQSSEIGSEIVGMNLLIWFDGFAFYSFFLSSFEVFMNIFKVLLGSYILLSSFKNAYYSCRLYS